MSNPTEVHIPRENTNDETVEIVAWLVASGSRVVADQPLVEVETSKSTVQIVAPGDGFVHYTYQPGEEIAVGGAICHIHDSPIHNTHDAATPAQNKPTAVAQSIATEPAKSVFPTASNGHSSLNDLSSDVSHIASSRFSREALALLAERNLSTDDLPKRGSGLVRKRDVLVMLGETPGAANEKPAHGLNDSNTQQRTPRVSKTPTGGSIVEGVPTRRNVLPRRKRMEGKYLRSGDRNSLASTVTRICPTRGLRAAAASQNAISGDVTAVIVFEVSRLLRQTPELCATHHDGAIIYYEEINIGFAVDAGHGLKVPVIHRADEKSLAKISAEMRDRVVEYLNDELPLAAISSGTFTISDLSGEGAHSFHPLINHGQAAILGVGAEFLPPGGGEGCFNLILSFDHQLTEGRAAAAFLNTLAQRLGAYEEAWSQGGSSKSDQPFCNRCLRSVDQLQKLDAMLIASKLPAGHVCSLCLAGY